MVRQFDLPISTVGVLFGGMMAVFGIAGTMLSGAVADRLFSRGLGSALKPMRSAVAEVSA